jgi:hypothetical protein
LSTRTAILWALLLTLQPQGLAASEPLRRYLLAVGANSGGPERVSLKYAVSDAERFADTMVQMGGVSPADRIVLREPLREVLLTTLTDMANRVSQESATRRTEVIFYYSGHADARGLRVGSDHLSYDDLRSSIEVIPATVRITVLDACASGAITRLKGGERRLPFLVDVSSEMEGYAFLTSSTGTEAAQESDAIGASFFTHYLVSGLRGAADVSGDGQVSLTEAYQFAFSETLARTTETIGGAQHPAYHINLSGTGDVVMTDVRHTSAGLMLSKGLQGRFYVRDRGEHLVAELFKPRERTVVLGLPAGSYKIHFQRDTELFVARVELKLDDLLTLRSQHFETADRESAVARGNTGTWPPRPGFMGPLVGRSRIGLNLGWYGSGVEGDANQPGQVSARSGTEDVFVGLSYSRWIREDIAVGASLRAMKGDVESNVGPGLTSRVTGLTAIRIYARKYMPPSLLKAPVRPFVSLGVGTLIGSEVKSEIAGGRVDESVTTMGAFGSSLGLGVDLIIAHRAMFGADIAYNLVTDFPEPLAAKRNYSGLEFSVNVSWLFGRGFGG